MANVSRILGAGWGGRMTKSDVPSTLADGSCRERAGAGPPATRTRAGCCRAPLGWHSPGFCWQHDGQGSWPLALTSEGRRETGTKPTSEQQSSGELWSAARARCKLWCAWRARCKLWCAARAQCKLKCGGGPEQVRKAQGREASAGRSAARPTHEEQPGRSGRECSGETGPRALSRMSWCC